jgi:hypothetical protein
VWVGVLVGHLRFFAGCGMVFITVDVYTQMRISNAAMHHTEVPQTEVRKRLESGQCRSRSDGPLPCICFFLNLPVGKCVLSVRIGRQTTSRFAG